MARLVEDRDNPGLFNVTDENDQVLAVGTLEIDLIPGATRHGVIAFHSIEPTPGGGGLADVMASRK